MTIDAPHLLLVSEALPDAEPPLMTRPQRIAFPMIFDAVTGSAADILMLMFGPPQHDNHMIRWRWHLHQRRLP